MKKVINNDQSVFDKLDHKNRNKSELLFYKLLAKQKLKANPFGEARSETFSLKETKPDVDLNN